MLILQLAKSQAKRYETQHPNLAPQGLDTYVWHIICDILL